MPRLDIFHKHVKHALVKDGWEITHDPLRLTVGTRKLYIDLGARRLIAAAKGKRKIAVEVKSFVSKSEMADLENAMGQFLIYRVQEKEISEPSSNGAEYDSPGCNPGYGEGKKASPEGAT